MEVVEKGGRKGVAEKEDAQEARVGGAVKTAASMAGAVQVV